jgi:hypothetical protein
MSWSSKNVMPYTSFETLPTDRGIYLLLNDHKYDSFDTEFNAAEWQLVKDLGKMRIYYRPAK